MATAAYESSKLAIILFAKEFAKRLQASQNLSCFTYYDQARYQGHLSLIAFMMLSAIGLQSQLIAIDKCHGIQ